MDDTTLLHYLDELYGYAMLLTSDVTEADGLVKHTCVCALPWLTHCEVDATLKSRLFGILRAMWSEQVQCEGIATERRASEKRETIAADIAARSECEHASHENQATSNRIQEALQRLSAMHREIIVLREFSELTYKEIADILNCSPDTVMSDLARARASLRNLLSIMVDAQLKALTADPS